MEKENNLMHAGNVCTTSIAAVKDTLYVVGGKWKIPIIIALTGGPLRFKELHRALGGITAKILSKELKELELNDFLTRTVYATSPVRVEYALTKYSLSLKEVIEVLKDWGIQHRKRIMKRSRAERAGTATFP